MTDLRRMFYNRYKTSSIFSTDNPSPAPTKDNTYSKQSFQKTFSPKYDKMTSKERYLREMRFNFKNTKKETSPKNNIKRSRSIKETRK